MAWFANSCKQKDDYIVEPGLVTFSFDNSVTDPSGGRQKDIATPAFVSYTVKKVDGSTINEKIELLEFNGSYVTAPQQLIASLYTLEQFLILDSNNQTIYASPLAGSPLADLVEHPLPLSFNVAAEEVTSVVPEVIALEDHTPEEFGYVKFGFEVVDVAALRIPALP